MIRDETLMNRSKELKIARGYFWGQIIGTSGMFETSFASFINIYESSCPVMKVLIIGFNGPKPALWWKNSC